MPSKRPALTSEMPLAIPIPDDIPLSDWLAAVDEASATLRVPLPRRQAAAVKKLKAGRKQPAATSGGGREGSRSECPGRTAFASSGRFGPGSGGPRGHSARCSADRRPACPLEAPRRLGRALAGRPPPWSPEVRRRPLGDRGLGLQLSALDLPPGNLLAPLSSTECAWLTISSSAFYRSSSVEKGS